MVVKRRAWARIAMLTLLAAGAGAALVFRSDVAERYDDAAGWIRGAGWRGALLVALLYVPVCIFLLPGSPLSLAAGAALGLIVGTVAVSVGSTLGACAAFLVSRYLARPWAERRIAGSPRFAAIDRAVARQGFRIVLLTRLSPIFPFNALNYAYGVTNVSFATYALATWIGMLPGTVMYVYVGTAASSLAQESLAGSAARPPGAQALFYLGLAAAVAAVAVVARAARGALANEVQVESDA